MLKQVPALAKEWLSLIKLITICALDAMHMLFSVALGWKGDSKYDLTIK